MNIGQRVIIRNAHPNGPGVVAWLCPYTAGVKMDSDGRVYCFGRNVILQDFGGGGPKMTWEIGQRVVTPAAHVGVIEEIEDDLVTVRLMTPDDKPSCCLSWCIPEQLRDGAHVRPMPRSKAWKAEAQAFYLHICDALRGERAP